MLLDARTQEKINVSLENMESLNGLVLFSDTYDEFEFNLSQFIFKDNLKMTIRELIGIISKYNMDSARACEGIDGMIDSYYYYKRKLDKIDRFLKEKEMVRS